MAREASRDGAVPPRARIERERARREVAGCQAGDHDPVAGRTGATFARASGQAEAERVGRAAAVRGERQLKRPGRAASRSASRHRVLRGDDGGAVGQGDLSLRPSAIGSACAARHQQRYDGRSLVTAASVASSDASPASVCDVAEVIVDRDGLAGRGDAGEVDDLVVARAAAQLATGRCATCPRRARRACGRRSAGRARGRGAGRPRRGAPCARRLTSCGRNSSTNSAASVPRRGE